MNNNEKEKIVKEINDYIQNGLWLDFEVNHYSKNKLIVYGGLDLIFSHDIEVHFEDVFFVSLPMEWKTDTKKTVFQILDGEEVKILNIKFRVEQGYNVFKFKAEDYPDDFGCLIGAKKISYVIL